MKTPINKTTRHVTVGAGRINILLLVCLVLLGSRTVAANGTDITLADLSSCSLTCLLGGISRTNCSALDITCQCESTGLKGVVADCLLADCTMQDTLDTARFTAAECNLSHESRSTEVIAIMSILYGAALFFMGLRVVSKMMTRTFCTEDYIIISAAVFTAAPFVCILSMAELGFGGHVWDLEDGSLSQILKLFYVAEILYVFVLSLIKISLVFMYLRIYWAHQPFMVASYIMLAVIAIPNAIIIFVTIVSCKPISYFWNRDLHGSCMDVTKLAYANSGFAVAQDVLLIVLPISMLWELNMSLKKKTFISLMFLVGGMGLVATIIRVTTLHVFGDLEDPTWDYVPVVYWTVAELAAGIICSSLPAIRILLEKFFKVFRLNTNRSYTSDAIRMERQRKPSVPNDTRWKDHSWEHDGAGGHELLYASNKTSKMSSFTEAATTIDSRKDFDFGFEQR